MPTQDFPDELTPLDFGRLFDALRRAAPAGVADKGVEIAIGHVALETGRKSCHCWNLGNVKWTPGFGRTMFACGEELPLIVALRYQRETPDQVEIRSTYRRGGVPYASVWFKPPHRMTWFRAFPSLESGAAGHWALLMARYPKAVEALRGGSTRAFVEALRAGGYFTAAPELYMVGVRRSVLRVRGLRSGRPTLKLELRTSLPVEDVRFWQGEVLGLQGGDVDGDFGPGTKERTREWQRAHHLSDDGEVGPVSWGLALRGDVS
jgi:peptidoglycan hydrolase-like protein with peptidoglycan-binding domain